MFSHFSPDYQEISMNTYSSKLWKYKVILIGSGKYITNILKGGCVMDTAFMTKV